MVDLDIDAIIANRPVGRFQYLIFFLCALVALTDGYDTQAIGYVAPLLAPLVHAPVSAFGLIFSAGLAGAAVGAFAFGPLADRIGRRVPLILACLMFGLFSIATVFVTSFGQLLLLRIAAGIGLGGAVPTGLAMVAEYAPRRLRGLAVTAVFSAFPLGGFIGGLAASRLIAAYGWHSVFIIGGALPLLVGLVMIALMPESLRFLAARGENSALRAVVAAIAPQLARPDVSFRRTEALPRRGPVGALFAEGRAFITLFLWVPFFLGFMVILTIVLWGPALLSEGGIPLSIGALIFAVHYLGGFIGTACAGYLVDKFGTVRVPMFGFLAGAASLAVFGQLTSSAVLLGIDAFFCGLLVVGATSAMLAVAAVLYPAAMRSTGIGWAMGAGRFGQVLGPLAVGAMLAAQMSKQAVFFAAALACVVCAAFVGLLALSLLRRKSPDVETAEVDTA